MSKTLITVMLLLGAATVALTQVSPLSQASSQPLSQAAQDSKDFNDFKAKFGKKYTKVEEENYRKSTFLQNKAKIDAHNKNSAKTYIAETNQFTDLTDAEFGAIYLSLKPPSGKVNLQVQVAATPQVAASAVDWLAQGKVTGIKNQGNCGSCWAFSAAANLESSVLITKGKSSDLSEQELVDCSGSYGNNGCGGGWMNNAFSYMKAVGISNETKYPYVAYKQTCKTRYPVYKVSSIVTGTGCSALNTLLMSRPVSVAVDATNWGPYKSGIFGNCGLTINHGVLVVAYTSTYWKIKNSWGTGWGEAGYIRLSPGNTCNVCTYPSYALPV